MATAEQIKALIKSHFNDDKERFYTISLQLAAHESKQGHNSIAKAIRDIVDKGRQQTKSKIIPFPGDLQGLVLTEEPETPKSSLVMPAALEKRIDRIIHEYRQKNKLKSHGLKHRRKILLAGPPGTGKTMTARVLSQALGLKLHTIQVDRLVTKFMGETSAKLRQIFDLIKQVHGIYLFDEFDAIGAERTMDNDVGEMRRVLNAFLQFIEQDHSDSLIIAATNNPKLLDHALFRRFEDVLNYNLPDERERRSLIENIMGTFLNARFAWNNVIKLSRGLSHSEIDYACRDAIKVMILSGKTTGNASLLIQALKERQNSYSETK
ncbi:MAG: AAA family ATPase [Proteobacteria bacterium]|nr:AAA family ATPase [Pseudomonadota bacterium]MBU1585121.1 AAA family ATPase [Pseudomonadota bacterium]MBU2453822.1 AAA family ATPase [Pseudomonadota bacterium]MBU2630060.1 AAA family ATPase [Pseudomonadota bacterium]